MSQAGVVISGGGGSGITTIDGDIGSVTGSTVSFKATTTAGASVNFTGSGAAMTFNISDVNNNTFIGLNAGNSNSINGATNTGIGNDALLALNGGSTNTCVGYAAGAGIVTGNSNTSLGYLTLVSATNIANTAIGAGAMQALTSGDHNSCFGNNSLASLSTGTNNLALGINAGQNYTTSESSNVVIQNAGTASESNVIRIGTQGSSAGEQNTCFIAGIAGVTVTGAAVLISASGQLGDISSSIRFKEDIKTLWSNENILKLRPVSFKYKEEKEKFTHYGFIAEEVESLCPDLVVYKDDQPYSVKYHEMTALLLVEIQKLKQEITFLKESRA